MEDGCDKGHGCGLDPITLSEIVNVAVVTSGDLSKLQHYNGKLMTYRCIVRVTSGVSQSLVDTIAASRHLSLTLRRLDDSVAYPWPRP